MQLNIIKQNSKGYLLATDQYRLYLIDDYSGSIEPGISIEVLGCSFSDNLVGLFTYCNQNKSGRINIAGEIDSIESFESLI